MFISEFLAIFFLLTFVYLLVKYPDRAIGTRARPDLRGPKGLPILGNTIHEMKNRNKRLENMLKEIETYGTPSTITILGLGRLIHVSRPEWLEHIQKTNFENYGRGAKFNALAHDMLGNGIFNADGESWKMQRKAASHVFTVNNFRGLITDALHDELKELRTLLDHYVSTGEAFDIQQLYHRFTLGSFHKMAFSADLHALSIDPKPIPFGDAFDYVNYIIDSRLPNPLWKLTEKFSEKGRRLRFSCDVMNTHVYKLIEERQELRKDPSYAKKKLETRTRDLLDMFLDIKTEDGKPLNMPQLRDMVLNFMVGGRDTTAQTLSWLTYRMMENPEQQDALRSELERLLPQSESEIQFDEFKHFKKSQAAFLETLRLHPPVPKNLRCALGDDQLPNGPKIYKGDVLTFSDWAMGRTKDLWGQDAEDYKPSRWIDANGDLQRETQWKFHAFNGGPRLCLGQLLATYEAVSVIVALLRDFDVHPVKEITKNQIPDYAPSLSLPIKGGLKVTVSKRASHAPGLRK